MAQLIGMDEAGYGPNLGPLVIAATHWELTDSPPDIDLYEFLDECITDKPTGSTDTRLHVADSKEVYKSKSKGFQKLESAVMAALSQLGELPTSFHELMQLLDDQVAETTPDIPWLKDADLELPLRAQASDWQTQAGIWCKLGQTTGIRLKAVRCKIMFPQVYNELLIAKESKGIVLSEASLQLMRSLWNPASNEPTLIIADKHGGRNRYDELLSEIVDGQMIFRIQEGTPLSEYRVGETRIRFQTKAEQYLPVALASLFAKYTRELAMELFNQFWQAHLPELKPTKGYPVDALRFRDDIKEQQQVLGISDNILWREK